MIWARPASGSQGCLFDTRGEVWVGQAGQTSEGSFSAVSTSIFASKYAFDSSRRDLHNALLCTAPKSHFFQKISRICQNLRKFSEILRNSQFFKPIFCENFEIAAVQKDANLVELEKCCQTHILLQNFVLIQPRTSPPKICKIFENAFFDNAFSKNVFSVLRGVRRASPDFPPGLARLASLLSHHRAESGRCAGCAELRSVTRKQH